PPTYPGRPLLTTSRRSTKGRYRAGRARGRSSPRSSPKPSLSVQSRKSKVQSRDRDDFGLWTFDFGPKRSEQGSQALCGGAGERVLEGVVQVAVGRAGVLGA